MVMRLKELRSKKSSLSVSCSSWGTPLFDDFLKCCFSHCETQRATVAEKFDEQNVCRSSFCNSFVPSADCCIGIVSWNADLGSSSLSRP